MPIAVVEIRGKSSEWGVKAALSKEQINAMRSDGIEVIEPRNIVPFWVASAGLTSVWCFFQDAWNFKIPFWK